MTDPWETGPEDYTDSEYADIATVQMTRANWTWLLLALLYDLNDMLTDRDESVIPSEQEELHATAVEVIRKILPTIQLAAVPGSDGGLAKIVVRRSGIVIPEPMEDMAKHQVVIFERKDVCGNS